MRHPKFSEKRIRKELKGIKWDVHPALKPRKISKQIEDVMAALEGKMWEELKNFSLDPRRGQILPCAQWFLKNAAGMLKEAGL